MKSIIGLVAVAAMSTAAPAFAATYGTIGYTNLNDSGANLGMIEGRYGVKFNPYIGLEAQADIGVSDSKGIRADHAVSGYVVGSWPVTADFDLLARVGFGKNELKATSGPFSASYNSWNYGVGGQYFFNGGKNGVRVDYTHVNFTPSGVKDGDAWSVAYVRKF